MIGNLIEFEGLCKWKGNTLKFPIYSKQLTPLLNYKSLKNNLGFGKLPKKQKRREGWILRWKVDVAEKLVKEEKISIFLDTEQDSKELYTCSCCCYQELIAGYYIWIY